MATKPSSSKPKIDSSASNKKVMEKSIKSSISVDNKSRSTTHDSKKTASSQSKGKKTVTRTREKKTYSLPGQKFDVPEEREPLRIFYESLSKQIPSSEMAEFWLMEHGLLSPERAKKAFEKKQRKQKLIRSGTPIKSPTPSVSGKQVSSKPEGSKKPLQAPNNGDIKVKKRLINESDDDADDDDFVLSHKRRKG